MIERKESESGIVWYEISKSCVNCCHNEKEGLPFDGYCTLINAWVKPCDLCDEWK